MLDEERASVHIGVLFEAGTTVMKLETCCKQHTPIVRGKNTTCIRRWESHVILPLHHQTLHKIEMMIMSWEKKKQNQKLRHVSKPCFGQSQRAANASRLQAL